MNLNKLLTRTLKRDADDACNNLIRTLCKFSKFSFLGTLDFSQQTSVNKLNACIAQLREVVLKKDNQIRKLGFISRRRVRSAIKQVEEASLRQTFASR